MNINNMKLKSKTVPLTTTNKVEIGANYVMVVVGFIMTVIGIAVSALKQLGKL